PSGEAGDLPGSSPVFSKVRLAQREGQDAKRRRPGGRPPPWVRRPSPTENLRFRRPGNRLKVLRILHGRRQTGRTVSGPFAPCGQAKPRTTTNKRPLSARAGYSY